MKTVDELVVEKYNRIMAGERIVFEPIVVPEVEKGPDSKWVYLILLFSILEVVGITFWLPSLHVSAPQIWKIICSWVLSCACSGICSSRGSPLWRLRIGTCPYSSELIRSRWAGGVAQGGGGVCEGGSGSGGSWLWTFPPGMIYKLFPFWVILPGRRCSWRGWVLLAQCTVRRRFWGWSSCLSRNLFRFGPAPGGPRFIIGWPGGSWSWWWGSRPLSWVVRGLFRWRDAKAHRFTTSL